MEKEKMLAGQLYDPSDEELTVLRTRARKLARQYNLTDEDDAQRLGGLLAELVPNAGEGLYLQAPVHFDYGCFTWFGQFCSANQNLNPTKLSAVRSFYRMLLNPRKRLKTLGFKQVNNSFPFIRPHPLLRASRELAREKSREDIGF